jgi:hypothetical protein
MTQLTGSVHKLLVVLEFALGLLGFGGSGFVKEFVEVGEGDGVDRGGG